MIRLPNIENWYHVENIFDKLGSDLAVMSALLFSSNPRKHLHGYFEIYGKRINISGGYLLVIEMPALVVAIALSDKRQDGYFIAKLEGGEVSTFNCDIEKPLEEEALRRLELMRGEYERHI